MSEENFNQQDENDYAQQNQPDNQPSYQQENNIYGQEPNSGDRADQQEMNQNPGSYYQQNQNPNYNNYQQNPDFGKYPMNGEPEKKQSNVFGIVSMVLGILSLVFFCACINFPLAIVAIVFGVLQLVKRSGKGLAIAGLATAGASILIGIIFWGIMITSNDFQRVFWREFNNGYYDEYNDHDFFDDDYF